MRSKPPAALELARIHPPHFPITKEGDMHGAFMSRRTGLNIMSSGTLDLDWEHVSVSHNSRTPTWDEMCRVKDLFWSEDETVVQFHPKASEYVNHHPNCLHLWKRVGMEHELPPSLFV